MTHEDPAADALARQRRLVANLAHEGVFPHALRRFALIETHISFVVLTGDFAYKIKKAVDLGFVDYSTLDRRRFCCEEELRLNRRLAAPLYLDVVSIGGSAESPRVGAAPAIEYAVRMREFDQDCLLDRVLARGELMPSHLDALAAAIADFHRRAPAVEAASRFGTARAIALPMLDNFAALRRLLDSPAELAQLDAPEAWSRRQCGALEGVFAARRAAGRVRECHGDLHLGNMVDFADGLHVFDGIEFNPALRWIDVASEIAFLVMDLGERGRPDFAARFLDAYLAAGGDYDALAVLPFYLVYRAMVRAKVACIRAAQAATPAERAAALAGSRAYVDCARRATAPRAPALIITHGVSGAGKSFASQRLLEAFAAVRLRSDVERKRLAGLPPFAVTGSGFGDGLYSEAATIATYARLKELARTVVDAGFPAIVDAAFLRRRQRDEFRRLAGELGVPFVIVACAAPPALLRDRVARRQALASDASEADVAVLARQEACIEALDDGELALAIRVDGAVADDDGGVAGVRRRIASAATPGAEKEGASWARR